MDAVRIGPLALSLPVLILIAAVLVARAVAVRMGRRRGVEVETHLWKVLLVALVAARLAFVLAYFSAYRGAPWSVLDLRDGGLSAPAGMAAALAVAGWLAWRHRAAARPVVAGTLVGILLWIAGSATALVVSGTPSPRPHVVLTRLDGSQVPLDAFAGRPMVVNLWASWCPPCRREMPTLRDAQARHPEVVFVFANQGESAEEVRRYLGEQRLVLENVLLDPKRDLGLRTGSVALPTTLFFDRDGRLVWRRMGEVSAGTVEQGLDRLRNARD